MAEQFLNFFETPIQEALNAGDSQVVLLESEVSKLPSLGSDTLRLVVYDGKQSPEVLLVTAKQNSTTLSVSRAQEGTSARSWPTGSKVRAAVTAQQLSNIFSDIAEVQNVSGDLVGTTGSQTLENKTLQSPTVASPDIDGGTINSLDAPLPVGSGGTNAITPAQARSNLGITGTVIAQSNTATLGQNDELSIATPGIFLADRFQKRLVQVLEEDISGGQAVENRLDMDAGDLDQWKLEDFAPGSDLNVTGQGTVSEENWKFDTVNLTNPGGVRGLMWLNNTQALILFEPGSVDYVVVKAVEVKNYGLYRAFEPTNMTLDLLASVNVNNSSGNTAGQNYTSILPVEVNTATVRFVVLVENGSSEYNAVLMEYDTSAHTFNELDRVTPAAFNDDVIISDSLTNTSFIVGTIKNQSDPTEFNYCVLEVSGSTMTLAKDTTTFLLFEKCKRGSLDVLVTLSSTRFLVGWTTDGGTDGGNPVSGRIVAELLELDGSYNVSSYSEVAGPYANENYSSWGGAVANPFDDTHALLGAYYNDGGNVEGRIYLIYDNGSGFLVLSLDYTVGAEWRPDSFVIQPTAYQPETTFLHFWYTDFGNDTYFFGIKWTSAGDNKNYNLQFEDIDFGDSPSWGSVPIISNPSDEFGLNGVAGDMSKTYLFDVSNQSADHWYIERDQGYSFSLASGYWSGEAVNRTVVAGDGEVLIDRLKQNATGGASFASSGNADNAFDGDSSTVCSQTSADGNIGYDFGSDQTVRALGVWSDVSRTYDLVVEVSADNFSTSNQIMDIPAQSFLADDYLWFTIPSPQSARYIRIRETGGATLELVELVFSFGLEASGKLALSDFTSGSYSAGSWKLAELVHDFDGYLRSTKDAAVAVLAAPIDSSLWDSMDSFDFQGSLGTNSDLPLCFSFDERTYRIWTGSAAKDIASDDTNVHGGTDGDWYYKDSGGSWTAASSNDIWTALREAMQVGANVADYTVYEGMSQADWNTFGWTKSNNSIIDLAMLWTSKNFEVKGNQTLSKGDYVDALEFTYTTRAIWRQVDPGDYEIDLELPSRIRVEKLSSGTRDVQATVWSIG